jgi:ribosomal protein L37E
MSMAHTYCNDCGYWNNHVYTDQCVKCGSKNVDAEYDPSDWEENAYEDSD